MAKVMDPLHSVDARGSVVGHTYSKSRAGFTVRGKTAPTQPRTKKQLAIRSHMQIATRAWQALSATDRSDWATWAAAHPVTDSLGLTYIASGFQAFCTLSARMEWHLGSHVDTYPLVPAPNAPAGFAAANGSGQSILTWTATTGSNLKILVFGVGPHSAGRAAKLAQARYINDQAGEAATMTLAGLGAGTWTFFAEIFSEDDGQVSTWVSDTAVVS